MPECILLFSGILLQLAAVPFLLRMAGIFNKAGTARRRRSASAFLICGGGLVALYAWHDADFTLLVGQMLLTAFLVSAIQSIWARRAKRAAS